ncbi:MAG: SDR family NAD(P)-dependent oxidoreductase [Acidobacteria bacterium]|nr:SDR family NAD(P)-dependent oxidoreductase [Acidobacteriota bacterium]
MGAALARAFARQGADVALLARRTDRLGEVADEVRALGRRAAVIACDVTCDDDLERAAAETRRQFGHIDVVVANAGYGVAGRLDELSLQDYRNQFETNVFGVLRTIYATLDDLKKSRGRLAIISSVLGHIATPGTSAYVMSKFAMRGLALALRHELRPFGVSVTLISPGFVETEFRQVDNRGVRHPQADDPIKKAFRIPADKAARHIVGAIARGRRDKVITTLGKTVVFTDRYFPGVWEAVVRVLRVKSRPEPGKN